jgi:hypothetical protein
VDAAAPTTILPYGNPGNALQDGSGLSHRKRPELTLMALNVGHLPAVVGTWQGRRVQTGSIPGTALLPGSFGIVSR